MWYKVKEFILDWVPMAIITAIITFLVLYSGKL